MATLPANILDPHEVPDNPADIGWPPTLPIELALRTASNDEIRAAYGYSHAEWQALRYDPVFLSDLAKAVELVKRDGMSFKLKAQLQADELLKTSWRLIHDINAPATVRADLIKATMRWAGYETKPGEGGAGGTTNAAFQININLG